jgi:hypothetical protein
MKLTPITLSVSNLEMLQGWQKKLTEYIDTHGKARISKIVTKMYSEDEQFRLLIDEAIESQGRFTQDQLNDWVKSNVIKAAQLDLALKTLPSTIDGLLLGIECMKQTVDQEKLSDQDREIFNSENFWSKISIEEVQNYCSIILDLS